LRIKKDIYFCSRLNRQDVHFLLKIIEDNSREMAKGKGQRKNLTRNILNFLGKSLKNLYLCRPCTGFTPEKKVTETRQKFLKDT